MEYTLQASHIPQHVNDTFYTYTVSVLRSKKLQSFVATVNQLSNVTVPFDSHYPIF